MTIYFIYMSFFQFIQIKTQNEILEIFETNFKQSSFSLLFQSKTSYPLSYKRKDKLFLFKLKELSYVLANSIWK